MDRIIDAITLYTIENGMLTWCVAPFPYTVPGERASGLTLFLFLFVCAVQCHDGRVPDLRECRYCRWKIGTVWLI